MAGNERQAAGGGELKRLAVRSDTDRLQFFRPLEEAVLQPAVAAGAKIVILEPFENFEAEGVFAMGIPGVLQAWMPIFAEPQGEPESVADRREIGGAAGPALTRRRAL
jgi:hypothetical protein